MKDTFILFGLPVKVSKDAHSGTVYLIPHEKIRDEMKKNPSLEDAILSSKEYIGIIKNLK